jgi:peroxiredoxin Q/BCP
MKTTNLTITILLLGALVFALGLAIPKSGASARSVAGEKRPAGPLQPGTPAPDFTLPGTDGSTIKLSSLRGHPVVLYFYPKDETPGCTKEACDFRDHTADLKHAGVTVLGVSTQDLASHRHFAAKDHIPFPLLSDPEGKVAALYGVPVRVVPGAGRFFGRTTFVIDKDGRVARTWPNVSVIGHVDEVLKFVRAGKEAGGTEGSAPGA